MTAVVAFAAFAPWLVVLPIGGTGAIVAHVLALLAAFHGAGQLLARLVNQAPVHPVLAIQWGIAGSVAISGLAIATRMDGLATQAVIVYGFAAVHTGLLVVDFAGYRARLGALRPSLRIWIVPAVALAAIGLFHVLGTAGDLGARPFDDDGHVLGQLQRLRETGTLGDPIGYPRGAQLGGQLALGALATLAGDVHLVRMLEGLAFVLALALACCGLRPTEAADPADGTHGSASAPIAETTYGVWALLLVVAGSAFAFAPNDPATCWTAIGLVVALHTMLAAADPPLVPLGLTAGALITLRFELAPIAIAAVAAAWWPQRGDHARGHGRRAAILVATVVVVVGPYLVARIAAWHSVASEAHALIAPLRSSLGVRSAIYGAVVVACAPLAIVLWRDRALRWLGAAAALTIAGIASQLTGDRPYATRFLWPLAIAGALILIVELARGRKLATGALLASLVVCVTIQEGRDATGRLRWKRRYLDFAVNVEYLRHAAEQAPVASGYDALLRHVPVGATVAVWVTRPERLDYGAGFRIVDLRTPRGARLRVHRWDDHASSFAPLLAAAGAGYLLLEADDKRVERIRHSFVERLGCTWVLPICADDLEAVGQHHRVIAEHGGVRLIDLRSPS